MRKAVAGAAVPARMIVLVATNLIAVSIRNVDMYLFLNIDIRLQKRA
jgi:hypothetical protein